MSDFGSVAQRRISRKPLAEGGWSCFVAPTPGYYIADPATAPNLRGTGELPSNGFMKSAAVEALYGQWLDTPDDAARQGAGAAECSGNWRRTCRSSPWASISTRRCTGARSAT